jgi:hypothetical protein
MASHSLPPSKPFISLLCLLLCPSTAHPAFRLALQLFLLPLQHALQLFLLPPIRPFSGLQLFVLPQAGWKAISARC